MRRIATALDLRGDWLPAVLADADERLSQIRHTVQADAGGLVVARDIAHARGIAELLRTITGQEAVVVTSDSQDAEQHISAFDRGRERHRRWIVAVRMISEGVDIRRLYVGAWATDILNSRLFFLQILGRFLRVTRDAPVPWAKQLAWLYIPAVKQLLEYARTVEEMRGALLVSSGSPDISVGANGSRAEPSTREEPHLAPAHELPSPDAPPQSHAVGDKDDARARVRPFEPLYATAQADGLTFQGIRYPLEVVRRAQELCLKKGWEDPSLLLVALEAMEHV